MSDSKFRRHYMSRSDPVVIRSHPNATPPKTSLHPFKMGQEIFWNKKVGFRGLRTKQIRVEFIAVSDYGPDDIKARVMILDTRESIRVSFEDLENI